MVLRNMFKHYFAPWTRAKRDITLSSLLVFFGYNYALYIALDSLPDYDVMAWNEIWHTKLRSFLDLRLDSY